LAHAPIKRDVRPRQCLVAGSRGRPGQLAATHRPECGCGSKETRAWCKYCFGVRGRRQKCRVDEHFTGPFSLRRSAYGFIWASCTMGGSGGFRLAGLVLCATPAGRAASGHWSPAAEYPGYTIPGLKNYLRRERRAAAASSAGVGVPNDKLGAIEVIFVVDLGPHQVLEAHWIDK